MTAPTGPEQALEAARAFALRGRPRDATPFGSGHIHATFSVRCETGSGDVHYVLQRINEAVFPEPLAVVANADLVTETLRQRLRDRGSPDLERRCLHYLPTRSGERAHADAAGVWRACARIEGTKSYDAVTSPEQARRAAFAFGDFATQLADLDPTALALTIPGFHDFAARFRAFERAVEQDPRGRAAAASPEIQGMRRARTRLAGELPAEALEALPVRAVHNDCKLNNVLFDAETGEALCVIDLDTVMPGSLLTDFGDLVRTAACREPEDSPVLERVRVEPDLYEALAAGYLEATAPLITTPERALLPLAGPLIALETGLRFLGDHLAGDLYFRATRPDQNLDRARTQLRLTESLLDNLTIGQRVLEQAATSLHMRPPRSP